MTFANTPLQSGVDYSAVAREGAFIDSIPHNIDTFTFGPTDPDGTIYPYGESVVYDTDHGIKLPVSGVTVAADVAGFVAYANGGVTDERGLEKGGLYSVVPALNHGRIYAKVTTGEDMLVGDAVSLNLAAGDEFNTVRKLPGAPAASDIDISSIATVAEKSNGGFVLLTINKYIK